MFDISVWEVGFGVAVSAVTCGVLFGLRWFFRPANPDHCPVRGSRRWCRCDDHDAE